MHKLARTTLSMAVRATLMLTASVAALPAMAEPTGGRPPLDVDRPDLIHHNYCSVCHGERGDGRSMARYVLDPPPIDFTDPEIRKEMSRAHMIETLRKGAFTDDGKQTAMVSWTDQLGPEHIAAVVDFVIVKFMKGEVAPNETDHGDGHKHAGHDHSASNVEAVDYPYGLTPDPKRGAGVYEAKCASCHGVNGDGKGEMATRIPVRPRNFRDPDFRQFATGFTLFSAISRGNAHMPAWEQSIDRQEIADVAEYVLKGFAKDDHPHSHSHSHQH